MQYSDDDDEDAEGEEDDYVDEDAEGEEDEDAEGEEDEYEDEDAEGEEDDGYQDEDDAMGERVYDDIEEDLLREMEATDYGDNFDGDTMDLMMGTPAATARMRKEANDIYRASSMRSMFGRKRESKYSTVSRDLYKQLGYAEITEPPGTILQTEEVVTRLYNEGVGAEDDEEKLDDTLAGATEFLIRDVWEPYVKMLPRSDEEHGVTVGPGPNASDFEKGAWIAALLFRLHHAPPMRDGFGAPVKPPLPRVLFEWQDEYHNPCEGQVEAIFRHRPSPAAHSLFWQAIYMSLIRGDIAAAVALLRQAGWSHVKKGTRGEPAYTGQPLKNIERVVEDVCHIMEACPGANNDSAAGWDIQNSDWTLFRLKAKAAKENLINFSEGKDRPHYPSRFGGSEFGEPDGPGSLTTLARKAESRLPWDVYESLQSLYSILIGEADSIIAAAQDWCEATIGLFGWWDNGHSNRKLGLSRSQAILGNMTIKDEYLDRLSASFHAAMDSDFHFNGMDAVEACIACAFESNVDGVIGFLRAWSLPIAATAAEVASLGRWLPPPEPQNLIAMDNFDADDLEVLGMSRGAGLEQQDGVKDTTLIYYARALNELTPLTGTVVKKGGVRAKVTRDGWEMAVQVVGRMDSPERSEELVNDLLRHILDRIEPDSHATIDKIWALLNDLGMINFAEDTAEVSRRLQWTGGGQTH